MIYSVEAKRFELKGTDYEIGQALGKKIAEILALKAAKTAVSVLDAGDVLLAVSMSDRWCPGLNEKIIGMA